VNSEFPVGIKSFGVCLPRLRMSRGAIADAHAWALPSLRGLGKGEKAICNWDEDVITMAVEAARDCLRGADRTKLTALDLASTTAPYADLQNAALVAAALRAPAAIACADFSGSIRAGLSALLRGGADDRLVIAAEKRASKPGSAQEMQAGSGAAALLMGSGDDLLARLLDSEAVAAPFVDHFRQSDQKFDYNWEERWIRDEGVAKILPPAVARLLQRLGRTASDIAWFGFSGGPVGGDKQLAKVLSIAPERLLPDLQGKVGDTGTAQPLLQLVAALEAAQPGDLIVIASFASGCEVVAFEMLRKPTVTGRRGLAGALARGIPETAYLKLLSSEGHLEIDWGMRAERDSKTAMTELYRSVDQILGFCGGRCQQCDAIQFPRLPACVNCGAVDSQQPHPLAEESARVATYTADWLMYTPAPPLYVGLVQFDNGARVLMEMVDVGPQGIDVGTPLEMVFRIKERDKRRHFDRYFWKATPAGV
jgi:3-hydroxy-3-methylglutaryl CoA synthase/uncharacterized OB-fold protein